MADPLVYVIVVNWNGREHLQECFDSLLRTSYAGVRFLLVDNASEDDSAAFVEARFGTDARVEVRRCERNLGWSRGNNVGLVCAREAGADYALLLNNDTAIDAEAVARLVACAEANPAAGVLAPKLLLYDNPEIINSIGLTLSAIGSAWDRGLGRLDGPGWDEPVAVAGACGAGMFIRLGVLEKTGLLPESFEIYLDDLDLCLRVWDAGYEVRTCPKAVIRHKFSATMGGFSERKYYLNTRNRARIVLRNFPGVRLPTVALKFCIGECRAVGRALLRGSVVRAAAHVRSWFSALGYLPAALGERARKKRAGMRIGRFWDLVCERPAFFPGIELPEMGWYRARRISGKRVRPMSSRAYVEHPGGRLRVLQVNCYPRLGALAVQMLQDGNEIASLDTLDVDETVYDLPAGRIAFVAGRVFTAEETGEDFDVGGWIGLESVAG